MKNLENIIIEEMEKHHPNPVSDAEFWQKLEETYSEFELNNVVMGLYKRGVIGFMPYHKKGSSETLNHSSSCPVICAKSSSCWANTPCSITSTPTNLPAFQK